MSRSSATIASGTFALIMYIKISVTTGAGVACCSLVTNPGAACDTTSIRAPIPFGRGSTSPATVKSPTAAPQKGTYLLR